MSKARDIADLDFNSPDIDGGNIDGATIGGTTPAAGTFSGLTVNGSGGRQYINSGHIRLTDGYNIEWGGGTNFLRGYDSSGDMALNATGDLTIDVVGDINLDADGGDIRLKDAGTQFGKFTRSSGDFIISASETDKDMKFAGADGSSDVTALTLDMSAAGAATFNSSVTAVSGVFKNAADATGTTIKVQDNADRGITITSPIAASAAAGRIATSGTANSLEIGVRDYPTALTIAGGSGAATFSSTVTSTGLPLSVNTSLYNSNASLSYYAADNAVYLNGAGDAGWLRLQASGTSNGSNYIDIFGSGQGNYIVFKAGSTNSLNLNTGSAVFNESGADVDFRVESNDNTHALFVDAGNNRVGVGSQGPRTLLELQGSTMPETGDAASVEDMLNLYRNGSATVWSGGATLALGRYSTGGGSAPKSRLDFKLKNDAGSNTALPETTVMSLQSQGAVGINTITPAAFLEVLDPTSGSFYGSIHVGGVGSNRRLVLEQAGVTSYNIGGTGASSITQFVSGGTAGIGSVRTIIDADGNLTHNKGAVFNETGGDHDFRVESNDNTHALYVDGGDNYVGINRSDSDGAASLSIKNKTNGHATAITSENEISDSGERGQFAEGTIAVDTVSSGNTLSIPITSQGSKWERYTIEMMFVSGEYNSSGTSKNGTLSLSVASLNSLNTVTELHKTGNVSGVTKTGMNLQITFTGAYTGGLNNYEGVLVYYKILGTRARYIEMWNATLN